MTLGNVDALEVHPAEARVVDVELLLEGIALLAEDRVGLVDEHARVEDERDHRDGHVSCRVVGGMDHTGVIEILGNAIVNATGGNVVLMMIVILWASAILSSILDNIPFVATMITIIMVMEASGIDVYPLWWALSLGACLGGNGTLVGASANVVLSGIANKEGYNITFMSFTKVAFPLMLVTVVLSTIYLLILF